MFPPFFIDVDRVDVLYILSLINMHREVILLTYLEACEHKVSSFCGCRMEKSFQALRTDVEEGCLLRTDVEEG